jgi:hypothetical protein
LGITSSEARNPLNRTCTDKWWLRKCMFPDLHKSLSFMFLKGTSQWPEHALVSAQILGGNCNLDRYWLVFQLARSETLEFPCLIQSIQLQDTSTIQNLRTPIQPLCICEKNPSPGSTWGYYGFFAYFVTEQKCWSCRPKLFGLSKMPQLSDLHRSCRLGQSCKNTGTPIQIRFFRFWLVFPSDTQLLDFSLQWSCELWDDLCLQIRYPQSLPSGYD